MIALTEKHSSDTSAIVLREACGGSLGVALRLEPLFRDLCHGQALEAELVVGGHGVFRSEAGLQVHHGAGVRGAVNGRGEGLQAREALGAGGCGLLAERQVTGRAVAGSFEVLAHGVVGRRRVEPVGLADLRRPAGRSAAGR